MNEIFRLSSEETTYLGQKISSEERLDNEISSRIGKAWMGFWAISVYKANLPVKRKATLLESCKYPFLTYGSQTRATTNNQLEKLRRTQLAMERSIIGTRLEDKIRSTKIREHMGTKDIRYTIKKLKLKYADYVERSTGYKGEREVLYWTLYGQGSRGRRRLKMGWTEEIVRHTGLVWGKAARVRSQ